MSTTLFPLLADLRGRAVCVVGGDASAERQVEALLRAGALPRVGASALTPRLLQWAADGRIALLGAAFEPSWLDGAWLVVIATGDTRLRQAVAEQAEARRLLVSIADAAALPVSQPATPRQAVQPVAAHAPGVVTLVGAGPGDAGLLTLKAVRAMQAADVILHDRLVSDEVLAMAGSRAIRIEVGKSAQGHSTRQEDIHALMLEHARAGRRVVRLKGGDPFVFGRGGEELQALKAHGVPFEVVPGITAALACAAYAGIPLTHRDHAQAVRLVTAHCKDSMDTLDWQALAQERQTLAVYMGVAALATFRDQLIAHGRAATTPFALVENGSRREQRVVTGTLADLAETARRFEVRSPALLIVGEVATLAHSLHWHGAAPLAAPTLPEHVDAPSLSRAA